MSRTLNRILTVHGRIFKTSKLVVLTKLFGNNSPLNSMTTLNMSCANRIKYLSQEEAINLDKELFNECAFSVDQLMELAGLSVASVIAKCYPKPAHEKPVICCGPGNNGGDGLVCARHLKLFGYAPIVICPKPGRGQLYTNLLTQCESFDIPVIHEVPKQSPGALGNLIVDSIFGFSYKPPNRNLDFARLLNLMHYESSSVPLVSIDIPSGWHVESGDVNVESDQAAVEPELRLPVLKPDCLISLTAPKLCSKAFKGAHHYLGGRFVPDSIVEKYQLFYPRDVSQFEAVKLS